MKILLTLPLKQNIRYMPKEDVNSMEKFTGKCLIDRKLMLRFIKYPDLNKRLENLPMLHRIMIRERNVLR